MFPEGDLFPRNSTANASPVLPPLKRNKSQSRAPKGGPLALVLTGHGTSENRFLEDQQKNRNIKINIPAC
jgi:hypothetical protein